MFECPNCKVMAENSKRQMDLIETLVKQLAPSNEEIHPSLRRKIDGDVVPLGEGSGDDD